MTPLSSFFYVLLSADSTTSPSLPSSSLWSLGAGLGTGKERIVPNAKIPFLSFHFKADIELFQLSHEFHPSVLCALLSVHSLEALTIFQSSTAIQTNVIHCKKKDGTSEKIYMVVCVQLYPSFQGFQHCYHHFQHKHQASYNIQCYCHTK